MTGAGAGAVIGKQLAGDNGALIGAAIGGLIGMAVGRSWADRVEEARAHYQNAEERLAATLAASHHIQKELVKENRILAERVEKAKIVVGKLLKDYHEKKIAKEKLVTEQKDLDRRRKDAETARTDLERAIASEELMLTEARRANLAATSALEQSIMSQRKELASLQQLERELVELSAALSV